MASARSGTWDPLCEPPTHSLPFATTKRIQRDIQQIMNSPLPGIHVSIDEECISRVHVLVVGPADTPYEGGFFHFLVGFTSEYPIKPPRVRIMNTNEGQMRFGPNLYANGKVCLSILGTWQGPPWTPAMNLSTVLLSVQSLLNDQPLYNEPGFDVRSHGHLCEQYNKFIQHQTLKIAVCDFLEEYSRQIPRDIRVVALGLMPDHYQHYMDVCRSNRVLEGRALQDHLQPSAALGQFSYQSLESRLEKLYINRDR